MRSVPGAVFAGLVMLLPAGRAVAVEPVAVVTELHTSAGEIEVKRAGEGVWELAKPLLALRPGDQIRALGDGRAVLVFAGGRGTQVVSAANSPFSVEAREGIGVAERTRAVVGRVAEFLIGQQKDLDRVPVASRPAGAPRVVILSPRDTRVLPGALTFEWAGWGSLRYGVRLSGPQGVMWEQADLPRPSVAYPASAPALVSNVRYSWQLDTSDLYVERTSFEVVSASNAQRIRDTLDLLAPATLAGYSRSTIVVLRAGLLLQERLYADARRELLAGLAADPDEPTLHVLLGQVYERVGLAELAVREFAEARDRVSRRP